MHTGTGGSESDVNANPARTGGGAATGGGAGTHGPPAAPGCRSVIGVSPHGAGLLLQVTLDVLGEEDWFGRALSGKVYVAAVPELDVEGQTISLSGIHADTSSRSVLASLAGELLEPALESRLQANAVIDLAPILAIAKEEMEAGLRPLSENEAGLRHHSALCN